MSNPDLRAFFERYVAALNTHAFAQLAAFMEDALVVNGQPTPRDDVIAGLEGHIDAVPDMVWRVADIAVDGERIAARFFNTGVPIKPWLGAEPTGARVDYAEHVFHKVRDGRFYELNFLLDAVGVQAQLAT